MLLKQHLIDDLAASCKSQTDWKIGCEHEVFLFNSDNQRLTYEGDPGIQKVLQHFKDEEWDFVYENEHIIGLSNALTGQNISLEPGGQLEFADCPQKNLHDVFDAHCEYWAKLDQITSNLNIFPKYQGLDDITSIDQVPWMPKGRYGIMKKHMQDMGTHGLWMMTKTCTVQVSLDFDSEADMAKKFRVSMALQPIVSAMFANSSLNDHGQQFNCYRTHIWQNTDPARCGILPFVFDRDFDFERYVDYALSVPMYFVKRDQYIDCRGDNFKDFMDGKLSNYLGHYATLKDWKDQLTVCFPEVRLKYYLEQRGADCGSKPFIMALPALWVGLLYDADNLQQLSEVISEWTVNEIMDLYYAVPKQGLNATIQRKKVIDIAKWLIELSTKGLESRSIKKTNTDESVYLDILRKKYFN